MRLRAAAWWLAVVLALASGEACKRSRAATSTEAEQPPTVSDGTQGLLLTWIDDKGDFHIETRVADVPMMGRDAVRVVDPAHEEGSQREVVYIADLRQMRPDGTYAMRTISRPDFEAIAVARREKGGPTLAKAAPPLPPAPGAPDPPAGPSKAITQPAVIVYGAEWCGACHEAMRYLRRKGVAYVEKDVEKDPSAAREMQRKLAKNGLRAGSIPIIDVRGKLMVGFNPAEIDAALGQPL